MILRGYALLNALFTISINKILAEIENWKGRIFKLPAPYVRLLQVAMNNE